MKKIFSFSVLCAFIIATASCAGPEAAPVSNCILTAAGEVTVFQRPSASADVFSTLKAGDTQTALAKTADGWFGFDPGVAQAGSVGVFRYRWVRKSDNLKMAWGCDSLPEIVGPEVGVCYLVAMDDTPVYSGADENTSVVVSMKLGDFAEVVATTPDWVNVDLGDGNMGVSQQGWVSQTQASFTGPCGPLTENTPSS